LGALVQRRPCSHGVPNPWPARGPRRGPAGGAGRKQATGAVGLLLLHRGETLSTDRLIDDLWGERPPAKAAKAGQVRISRLRKALAGEQRDSADMVATRGHGYELELDPERLDAHRFERLVAAGGTELGLVAAVTV
jgi:DNA-binding SARP family transcriptional activator